jgi:hypothetical protein
MAKPPFTGRNVPDDPSKRVTGEPAGAITVGASSKNCQEQLAIAGYMSVLSAGPRTPNINSG